jgi:hypothetical protein
MGVRLGWSEPFWTLWPRLGLNARLGEGESVDWFSNESTVLFSVFRRRRRPLQMLIVDLPALPVQTLPRVSPRIGLDLQLAPG